MNTCRHASHRPGIGISVLFISLACFVEPVARNYSLGATDDGTTPATKAASASANSSLDATSLARRIDELLAASWAAEKVEPAPAADDAEFLRRVYLDLAGKIPSVGEARAFLDDANPEKRRVLVEHLLGRATYQAHVGRTLRDLMLPGASANIQLQFLNTQFDAWLRLRLADNVPYDQLVRDVLTYAPSGPINVRGSQNLNEPSPAAFYQFNEQKPENLAASTARLFLGVQLECAQCHNHPFAKWKREEFWSLAAFFGTTNLRGPGNAVTSLTDGNDRRGIQIPGTSTTVPPRLLGGTEPDWQPGESTRGRLARWVTSAENPYFARAAANRLWAHFFGRGLVDPVDDLDDSNPPSHPAALDELTRQFVYHEFDLKYLVRTITATRAYQLSSQTTHASQDEPTHFARMPLRSMTAEQLFDSLAQATGYEEQNPGGRAGFAVALNSPRGMFLTKYADSGPTRTEYQASILQALTLMNGQIVADATSIRRSETLQAIVEAPFFDTPKRIEALFLATLSRRPNSEELAKMQAHVDRAASPERQNLALADIFWALLNSAEFVLNH